ncbi:replication initiator protein A [Silanimonas sp.]|jgi:plasmid replication initiation protein|uniref:replication initiator protein A n=1 Tax=Silanimonas sp. TaxID=1929290 RepID=UPI0022C61A97|nr:replication initiator protein A [Silanimonas sp.]MCZ8063979.1 replication initiator protein A [Silanimonas sp.]
MVNDDLPRLEGFDDSGYRQQFAKLAMAARIDLVMHHGKDLAEVMKLSDHDAFDLLNSIPNQPMPTWARLPSDSPANLKPPKRSSARRFLAPDKHGQQADFFVADVIGAAVKDDIGSMEHPIFSLKKSGDTEIRRYEHNGVHIEVTPSVKGIATVWDKDVLIYAISQLIAKRNDGIAMHRTVRFKAYDLLVATNRGVGGREYDNLEAALERLAGTRIKTDLRTNDTRTREGFGLIESWKVVERRSDERMDFVEITLSDWLYRAVVGNEVLTLDRDYFRLSSSIDRRLYELARKHCGNQATWSIGLELLQKKTGSRSELREFREQIRERVASDQLPGYHLSFDDTRDMVTFSRRNSARDFAHGDAVTGHSGT